MRFRELRRVLRQVVLAGLPAVAACGSIDDGGGTSDGDPCYQLVGKNFRLELPQPDAAMQFLVDSCRVDAAECPDLCSKVLANAEVYAWPERCEVGFEPDGSAAIVKTEYRVETYADGCAVAGRRPSGLGLPGRAPAASAVGAWLAHAAWLEGASVHAFVALARELEAHAAPTRMVRAALIAAHDEVRHHAQVARLAARFGARVAPVVVAAPRVRPLEELAVENAVEGCVRETWGAAVALWQAHRAADPELRAVFAAIAEDELAHAALAWQVHRWIDGALDDEARARVAQAQGAAARELAAAPHVGAREAGRVLGLPDDDEARALVRRVAAHLWNLGDGGFAAPVLASLVTNPATGGLECLA